MLDPGSCRTLVRDRRVSIRPIRCTTVGARAQPLLRIDGTVVPCAAGGSLPFLPQETLRVLRYVRENYVHKAWRTYGFVDAFNPLTNWYSPDVLGIDVGITLLMAENSRTGFVWEQFMKNAEVQRGMTRAGFRSTSPALQD